VKRLPEREPAGTPATDSGVATEGRCVSCGAELTGRFCAACGEDNTGARDYSILHFLADAAAAFTNADSKIFRTVRTLVTRPGILTAEFLRGRRKPYVAPLQLFLIVNLLFFIVQPFIGWNTFTTPLRTHISSTPHKELAQAVVTRELVTRATTFPALAREFDAAAEVHAKTLIIVMVPLFALFMAVAYLPARRYFTHHLVFSLHFYAFLLLLGIAGFIVVRLVLTLLATAGARLTDSTVDAAFALTTLLALAIYLYLALRVMYRERILTTVAKAASLAIAVGVVLQLYRLILFFVTLYSI
jgi:hypothetical protein